MRKLAASVLAGLTFYSNAYALTGSFFENNTEYGLTDKLYSVSQIDSIQSELPDGCKLLSCQDAVGLKDRLNYSTDYFICDKGVVRTYDGKICSIVELNGKELVRCDDQFLNEDTFRAFVSCPLTEETSQTEDTGSYLGFTPDPNAFYCSKDLNGDGYFDQQGEIQECLKDDTKTHYICPIDKVACKATYDKPLCPQGTLNPDRDMCQANAKIECPSGYTWDSSLDKCVLVPDCPDGGVLNTVRDRCEKTVINECPQGYTYDSSRDTCIKSVDCGDGVFVPERNRCEKSVTLTCPAGYTLVGDKCVGIPVCLPGTKYNSTYNKCVASVLLNKCPTGYTYNPATKRCETKPVCPPGFTYNAVTNRCETGASISYTCSANGRSYSSLTTCQANCRISGSCSGSSRYEYCYAFLQCPWGDMPFFWRNPKVPSPPSSSHLPTCPYPLGSNGYNIPVYIGGDSFCVLVLAKMVSSYTCSLNGRTYSNLSTCQANCVTTGACYKKSVCPSGSVLSGNLCIANPTCPSGGTFDGSKDVCWTNYTPVCPTGTTYDKVSGLCITAPTCNFGTLNPDTDKCEVVAKVDCGDWNYDSNLKVCYSNPVCSYGLYNENLHKCVATVKRNCGTYSYDSLNKVCYAPVSCPSDSSFPYKTAYSPELNKCVSDAVHVCPKGDSYQYSWNPAVKKCELVPICADGVYTPETDGCYVGDYTCPVGDYPCVPVNGKNYCSPHPCQKWSSAIEYDDTPEGVNDKQNDGEVNESGCLGTIYIFNGKDYRCRPPGLQTGGLDCCKKGTTWFGLGQCKESEKVLAKLRSWGKLDGQCHYVGSYCAVKVLGICLQKKKTYCCFHSVLARIVQEQGRKQLGIGWGTPKSPNCRGFTPDEFQRIDFSKIDFSEWYSEVQKQAQQGFGNFKQQGVEKIKEYFNQLKNYGK